MRSASCSWAAISRRSMEATARRPSSPSALGSASEGAPSELRYLKSLQGAPIRGAARVRFRTARPERQRILPQHPWPSRRPRPTNATCGDGSRKPSPPAECTSDLLSRLWCHCRSRDLPWHRLHAWVLPSRCALRRHHAGIRTLYTTPRFPGSRVSVRTQIVADPRRHAPRARQGHCKEHADPEQQCDRVPHSNTRGGFDKAAACRAAR